MNIRVKRVDYKDKKQAEELLLLLSEYAVGISGGGEDLSENTKQNLVSSLARLNFAFSFICYVDDVAAGFVNAFYGFSTFKCKPLINIHDLAVSPKYQKLGLSYKLLSAVEDVAKENECCKITLEVLEGNKVAKKAYRNFGFKGYELDPEMGKAIFWQKEL